MEFEFKLFVRELKELLKTSKNSKIESEIRYQNDDRRLTIPLTHFKKEELKTLIEILDDSVKKNPTAKWARDNKWTRGRIWNYLELAEGNVEAGDVVKKVSNLAIALKRYIEINAPHRWVFRDNQDNIPLPYFVGDIKFTPRRKDRDGDVCPAYVTLTAYGHRQGERKSLSARWSEEDWRPMTVNQALESAGFVIESAKAVERYLAELEEFAKYQGVCGVQVYGVGDAFLQGSSSWYSNWSTTPLVRNGEPTRLVIDPLTEELGKREDKSRLEHTKFWETVPDTNGLHVEKIDDEEAEPTDDDEPVTLGVSIMLPLHPYVYAFDLDKHQWVNVHVVNLQPYPWDKKLIDKLILPADQKELLEVLMSTTGENVEDIVRGKMSGVIVLATGAPGVGKTLTAEVFSEFIEKPLYSVQCSQLGLDVQAIEGTLLKILQRAARWGAVLLIDEADVYIRERGEDIQQNAIVGVFLRLLEYYRGVLFMTSNRDVIDDAILSRATAWIKYELPDKQLLKEIWRVLADQFKVKLTAENINQLITSLPSISGRTVRNVLKLAIKLRGTKATVADILRVSKYQPIEEKRNGVKELTQVSA